MRRLLLLALTIASSSTAHAQRSLPLQDFSAHRFYVAPGPGNFVMVEGGDVGEELMPTFGATLGYGHRPYAADDLDCVTEQTTRGCGDDQVVETDLVSAMLTLQLYGSLTFLERVQVGLNVPVLLYFDGERYEYIETTSDRVISSRTAAYGGAGGGLADPRVSAKVRILDPDPAGNGVILSAAAHLTVPIGHYMWERHFVGDRLPNAGLSAIGGLRLDAFRLAINVGFDFREEQANLRSAVGPELTWGAAAAYRFHPLFEALVEATGATSFGQRFDSEAPTEVRAAALLHLGEVCIHLGGGAGLVYGIGVPVFHVFGGASFAPQPARDSDSDGLNDQEDGCPADAEDEDGFEDEDGCPDLDNDQDEVPDAADPCPDEPEDVDGFEDEDGCPDEDDDGDGISDGYDSCPRDAEDVDGDRDADGCPDEDADGDGLADELDQCPSEAEDFDGFGDDDGCPELDFDGDGVPDDADGCPEEAEDADGFEDGDGCPEEGSRADRRRGRRKGSGSC